MNPPGFLIALLNSIPDHATADIIARSLCTCTSPTPLYTGYVFLFSYLSTSPSFLHSPSSNINNTYLIADYCGPSTSCSQDFFCLRAYKAAKNEHAFTYHRELVGPDQYEVDGSGRGGGVPVKQARQVGDVVAHCDGICAWMDGSREMSSRCKGGTCKTQVGGVC